MKIIEIDGEEFRVCEVGTYVKIRSWKSMVEEFGVSNSGTIQCKNFFIEEMRYLCGRIVKIKRRDSLSFECEDLYGRYIPFVFSMDMFEIPKKHFNKEETYEYREERTRFDGEDTYNLFLDYCRQRDSISDRIVYDGSRCPI